LKINDMKRIGFVFAILLGCMVFEPVWAQDTTVFISADNIDIHPEFPGGNKARLQMMIDNIVYPRKAKEEGVQGQVIIGFVVEQDGSLSDFTVIKSVHPLLDEEALRFAKIMPNWKPAMYRGVPVRVEYKMPITFELYDDDDDDDTSTPIPQETKKKQKRK
jgi:TonB family protein